MQHQSYYRIPDGGHNAFAADDRPYQVNGTGLYRIERPYLTNMPQGRPDYYLQYCIEGGITVCENGRTHSVVPGQIIIIPPNTPYICKNAAEKVIYYWIHFTGCEVAGLLKRCDLNCGEVYTVGMGERIPRLFRALFREYLWRDRCFEDSCQACLVTIFAELSRMRDMNSQSNETAMESIFRSLSFFHNHIHKPITVAKMAEIEHFSPSRYRTVFRRCMGMSPSEYMTHMRMRRACELLSMADLSVREVADACGYTDQLYFSRVFRAHFGVAPSKFRSSEEESDERNKET
ncbi:MAG: helix-turn-helix domain-containing protein [Clostridia bacterium]|nr:helix-turn-helix domain-containing protein [Clostridia bacterium]